MKKTLKIIGIVFVVLVVGFFIAGIITPKVNYEGSVTVNKPLEETFSLFNELDQLKEWIPEMKSVSIISETPDKVDTKIKMIVEEDGKEMEMTETITTYIPNKKVGFYFEAGAMLKTNSITFTSNGTSTQISGTYTCEGSNLFYKSMFSFFKSYFKKIDQGYLDNFKSFAEKS